MIKILRLPTYGPCEVKQIENTLEALQQEVGGYIETLTLTSDLVLIMDEEGRLKGSSPNIPARIFTDGLVGTVIAAGISGEEFASVPEDIIRYAKDKLGRAGIEVKEANPVE